MRQVLHRHPGSEPLPEERLARHPQREEGPDRPRVHRAGHAHEGPAPQAFGSSQRGGLVKGDFAIHV